MTDQALIQLQRDTVARHIHGENAHDWSAVYDTFVQDDRAFYDVVPLNARFPGFVGVQDFYRVVDAAFPDFEVTVWAEYDVPGCSIREVTISGTHRGEYSGMAATGRPVRFQLAAFFLFGTAEHAGKLLAERIYFDNETVLRQLRGEVSETSITEFSGPHATRLAPS
jgi:predicted ester cyclase